MSPASVPPKFNPTIKKEITPEEMAIHLRQLYLIASQHDQAIIKVDNKIASAATTTTATTATTPTVVVAGVSAFNSMTGTVQFFPDLGKVNNQSGNTAYTVISSDHGKMIVLSNAAPIAVTLDSAVQTPWFAVLLNLNSGVATLTPTTGTVNGGGSVVIAASGSSIVFFDGTNWFATA